MDFFFLFLLTLGIGGSLGPTEGAGGAAEGSLVARRLAAESRAEATTRGAAGVDGDPATWRLLLQRSLAGRSRVRAGTSVSRCGWRRAWRTSCGDCGGDDAGEIAMQSPCFGGARDLVATRMAAAGAAVGGGGTRRLCIPSWMELQAGVIKR